MVETVAAYAAICVDHIVLEPVARGRIAARRAAMEHLMRERNRVTSSVGCAEGRVAAER